MVASGDNYCHSIQFNAMNFIFFLYEIPKKNELSFREKKFVSYHNKKIFKININNASSHEPQLPHSVQEVVLLPETRKKKNTIESSIFMHN